MCANTISRINIGIYITADTPTLVVKRTLSHLDYGMSFPVNKCYIYLDGHSKLDPGFREVLEVLSTRRRYEPSYFFNHLIHTGGADAYIFINPSITPTVNPLKLAIEHGQKPSQSFDFNYSNLSREFFLISRQNVSKLELVNFGPHSNKNPLMVNKTTELIPLVERNLKDWKKSRPGEWPLVSCILPTANRPEFIKQAIHYFKEQDYPNKELIIVYNLDCDIPNDVDNEGDIRLIQTHSMTIGAKRNVACRHAKGILIAQWDDDDIYDRTRLSEQLKPILRGQAHITGLTNIAFFSLSNWCCWTCDRDLHQIMFAENVAGGTLVFLKSVWEFLAHYPSTSLREDADFLQLALNKGACLKEIDGSDLFVYLRHNSNSWNFGMMESEKGKGWKLQPALRLVDLNSSFYEEARLFKVHNNAPLVSCIMPTKNRRRYIADSIKQFVNQDFKSKELLILDDGTEEIADIIPDDPQIHYIKISNELSLGEKRNLCCQYAKGDVIMHWDDDDFYASDWISYQYKTLMNDKADLCGLSQLYFYDFQKDKAWEYQYPETERSWLAGATMAYTRTYWKNHPFPNVSIGEDNAFVWADPTAKIVIHDYKEGFVARIHEDNTSPKHLNHSRWKRIDTDRIQVNLSRSIEGKDINISIGK